MRRRPKKPLGQFRLSQMVMTYGPGAPADLPTRSVLIGGLEHWEPRGPLITEPRLVQKIKTLFPDLPEVSLHAPPTAGEEPDDASGVHTWLFPEWFLTVDPERNEDGRTRSRKLVHRRSLTGWRLIDDDRKPKDVVPIRFVRACVRGHIDDIDWYRFAHGGDAPCGRQLWLDETGTSGDVGEIIVRCECGNGRRPIMDATIPGTELLGWCNGERPWLGPRTRERCDQKFRLLIRTASNAYFTQPISVISLPQQDELVQKAIEPVWEDFLQYVETREELASERAKKQKVKQALRDHSDEVVWQAIQNRRSGGPTDKTVKEAELEILAASQEETGVDRPDGNYYARALPKSAVQGRCAEVIEKVVLVHRLREVQALVGFTRFESMAPSTDGELEAGVARAALAREPSWFPAVETRGEGIFLHFKDSVLERWAKRQPVQDRDRTLLAGFEEWRKEHTQSKRRFCGIEYMMLHSLSHMLLSAVSLGCGYPSSSIRERVYALPQGCGILLYTASSDAEGTLGGLVEVGRRIGQYFDDALEAARLCSNDPVCAQHDPKDPHEQRFLHGAACHGCLLISETSCEQRNDFLDRALVVPTVDAAGAEFFALE
jgi:hypothetical protein